MGTQRRGEDTPTAAGRGKRFALPSLGRRHLLFSALLGLAVALLSAVASSAGGPTIEAAGGPGGYYWRPSSAEVGTGGTVTFKSSSSVVPHGVTWTGGPETPSCTGVPINEGRTSWSGSCTFAQSGTYAFECYVHPTEMTGTITVGSGGTITTNPPPPVPESPLNGPASQALRVARSQRGGFVRGSIDLSQSGAGARLEVDLLASRSSLLGAGHAGMARVGRLIRSTLGAGRASFTVSLKSLGRRALRRRTRLRLSVKVTVTPPHGDALTLTRKVVLHD